MKSWLAERSRGGPRPAQPGTDMMGGLLADPGGLDPDGVRRTLGGMFVGSIDTTATAVAKIVAIIAGDDKLGRRGGGRCRRYGPPARLVLGSFAPLAAQSDPAAPGQRRDHAWAGSTINAGDRIVIWTQAAMQDAAAFPAPRHLRPDRPGSAYLHFGDALHACAGRSVNAFQIPLLVGAILRRGIRLGGQDRAGPARSPII